ncbi:MAG: hypothetical protein AAF487_12385 [Bacteroidota bacterium]
MKKSNVILLSALALVIIVFVWLFSSDDKYAWYENYRTTNDQPFGLSHTLDFLKDIYGDREFIIPDSARAYTLSTWKDSLPSNFIHIGGYFPLDSAGQSELFQYVENGSTAMFIVKNLSYDLKDALHNGECIYNWDELDRVKDTLAQVNFNHPQLRQSNGVNLKAVNRKGPVKLNLYHFGDLVCDYNHSFVPIGTLNDSLVNFVEIPYGDGFIYIHSNPILFTNYFIIQKEGAQYASDVFAHLNAGPIIYEDLVYRDQFRRSGDNTGIRDYYSRDEGPFRYLLTQESFKWALYVLVGMLIIYFLIGTKRIQSPIPVKRLPENSSIEYVETISELYFQSEGKEKIAEYMFDQYYEFIKTSYQLSKGDDAAKFLKRLSLKSEVPLNELKDLEAMNELRPHKMSIEQSDLIHYYKNLERFYLKCK